METVSQTNNNNIQAEVIPNIENLLANFILAQLGKNYDYEIIKNGVKVTKDGCSDLVELLYKAKGLVGLCKGPDTYPNNTINENPSPDLFKSEIYGNKKRIKIILKKNDFKNKDFLFEIVIMIWSMGSKVNFCIIGSKRVDLCVQNDHIDEMSNYIKSYVGRRFTVEDYPNYN